MSKKEVFLKPTAGGQKAYDKLLAEGRTFHAHDVETAVGWDIEALFKAARKELKLKDDDKTGVQAQVAFKGGQLLYRYWL